jgi:hypothetical protein
MKAALFNIGDKVKHIDCDDPKTYTIDKIREHNGYWIYSMEGQGWKDGWAWVAEWNIERSE